MLAIKTILLLASTLFLSGCLTTAPKDSDPISSLNPSQQDLALYQQYGVNTVGGFKKTALEMKETGYVTGSTSHREMFTYLEDRETAKRTPGLTATKIKQQRVQAKKRVAEEKLAANQQALNALFDAKWSIANFSCNLGGGTYREFGEQFRGGERITSRGKIRETNQRTNKKFTVNDDGSITLSVTIYASGNRLMTQALGSPNAVVGRSKTTYKIQGDKLEGVGTIDRLRLEQLRSSRNPGFTTSQDRFVSTRCPD